MGSREDVVLKWFNSVANTPTFLSSGIEKLLKLVEPEKSNIEELNGLSIRNLLSSSCLSSVFDEDQEVLLLHPSERSSDWYSSKIHKASPFIAYFSKELCDIHIFSSPDVKELTRLCFWLHQQSAVLSCFELLLQKNSEENNLSYHECLLLITAMLERGLGNLFLYVSPSKKVPSLLRDLLASEELVQLLGQHNAAFLQLLLGSPLSLNLRNLLWHGFVGCGDILAKMYASVLLVICASVGSHLELNLSITAAKLAPRRWAALSRIPPKFFDFDTDEFFEIVNNTGGLSPSRKPIWLRAILHYEKGHHGQCCVLILPEIEHTLRMVYCAVNDCPARLLTAESVVHYTTLDTILDANNNRIPDFLGSSLYAALLDMLIEEEGPRIRDRFSHGECMLDNVDSIVSQRLLSLSVAILLLAEPMHHFPMYSSYFSQAPIFKRELLNALEDFGMLIMTSPKTELFSIDLAAWPPQYRTRVGSWLANWSTHREFTTFLAEMQCQRTVIPLSNTWRQIMKQICAGCKLLMQYQNSAVNAHLRSRQRATRARFKEYLPFFIRGTQLALLLPLAAFLGGDLASQSRQSEKIKKTAARWADNLASNSLNNRWNELYDCTKQLEMCFAIGLPTSFGII